MTRPCIVVAGMGRCGTSLTMQMLYAAGVPCVGAWPGFETDASSVSAFDPVKFAALSETAIKLIDPANLPVGDMPNHIVIWLDRDPKQQAKSQAKMMKLMGYSLGRDAVNAFAGDLRKSRGRHRARIGIPGGCPSISLRFEGLIEDRSVIVLLSEFLSSYGWESPVEAMVRQVRARPSHCLQDFLEATLLSEGGAS